MNLHAWIRNSRFSSVDAVKEEWRLYAYSNDELYQSFTPDFQRFAFSSYETFIVSGLERDKYFSMGWPLLKLYYGAFFAAHAIARATGNGQVHLNKEALSSVNTFLKITNNVGELAAGSYNISVIEDGATVYLALRQWNGGGGVHEGFWKYFKIFLSKIASEAVARDLPSAGDFLRETEAISSCLSDGPEPGIWFSSLRNAINYRHEMECWHPSKRKSPPRLMRFPSELRDTDQLESSLAERDDNMKRLANLSLYLCSLNREIIHRVIAQNGASNFSRSWRSLETNMTSQNGGAASNLL